MSSQGLPRKMINRPFNQASHHSGPVAVLLMTSRKFSNRGLIFQVVSLWLPRLVAMTMFKPPCPIRAPCWNLSLGFLHWHWYLFSGPTPPCPCQAHTQNSTWLHVTFWHRRTVDTMYFLSNANWPGRRWECHSNPCTGYKTFKNYGFTLWLPVYAYQGSLVYLVVSSEASSLHPWISGNVFCSLLCFMESSCFSTLSSCLITSLMLTDAWHFCLQHQVCPLLPWLFSVMELPRESFWCTLLWKRWGCECSSTSQAPPWQSLCF